MPKIYLFDVTKPKNKVFTVIEVPPFRPSDKGMSEMSQVTVVKRILTLDNLKRKMTSEWFYDSTFYTIPIEMHVQVT